MTYPGQPQPPAGPYQRSYNAPGYGAPGGYPVQGYPRGPAAYGYARPPAITTTVVITLFFGLFGLIPASIHSGRAREMAQPTNKYWKAFWITFGIEVAVAILLYVAVFAALFSAASYYG